MHCFTFRCQVGVRFSVAIVGCGKTLSNWIRQFMQGEYNFEYNLCGTACESDNQDLHVLLNYVVICVKE